MFTSFSAYIRRQPAGVQIPLWFVYGLAQLGIFTAKVFVRIVEMVATLITRSARSFFGGFFRWTGKGTVSVITAKIAGITLVAGCVLVGLGAKELGGGLMALSVIPIMALGLIIMATSPFRK